MQPEEAAATYEVTLVTGHQSVPAFTVKPEQGWAVILISIWMLSSYFILFMEMQKPVGPASRDLLPRGYLSVCMTIEGIQLF